MGGQVRNSPSDAGLMRCRRKENRLKVNAGGDLGHHFAKTCGYILEYDTIETHCIVFRLNEHGFGTSRRVVPCRAK